MEVHVTKPSSVSLAVWAIWSLLNLRVSLIDFLYLLPFLILNVVLVILRLSDEPSDK
jgi:hypothetical protein